jgi:hypothetical protein
MITNAQIHALCATDRQALVELLAAAYMLGAERGLDGALWYDHEVRELFEDTRRLARQPQRGRLAIEAWNREMGVTP